MKKHSEIFCNGFTEKETCDQPSPLLCRSPFCDFVLRLERYFTHVPATALSKQRCTLGHGTFLNEDPMLIATSHAYDTWLSFRSARAGSGGGDAGAGRAVVPGDENHDDNDTRGTKLRNDDVGEHDNKNE